MDRKRRRPGCLLQLVGLFLLIGLGWMGVVAVTHPWIYTVGGRVRPLPFWQGVGAMSGPGGAYRLYVSFEPTNSGSKVLPSATINGGGWLCAPGGRDYKVRVYGGSDRMVWRDMDGQRFFLQTWAAKGYSAISGYRHNPPKLQFEGRWDGDGLTMNDKGTLAANFQPDGTLVAKPGPPGASQPIRFTEHDWWVGDPCR